MESAAKTWESKMREGVNYTRWLYGLVVLLTVIAGLYLSGWIYGALTAVGDILTLYFTAWLLQFFFTPVVDAMARRGVPRLVGVSFVYLALGLVIAVSLAAAIPALYEQGRSLASGLSNSSNYDVITNTTNGVERFLLKNLHVPRKDIDNFTQNYSLTLRKGAFNAGKQLREILQRYLTAASITNSATTFFSVLNTIQTLLINLVLVLILAFYMTLDGHKLVRRALSYFPLGTSEVMGGVHVIINRKFGGYLRGQIILSASYGLLTYIIVMGFKLQDSAVLIAVLAGIMMLIPYVGAIAAVAIPMAAYALTNVTTEVFPVGGLVLLFVFLFVAQHIVLNLLAPRVMSSAVGMHPILVILGLLLGTKIAGLWGAIFGVPVFGVLLDTVDLIYLRVMERRYGFQPPTVADVDKGDGADPPHRPAAALGGGAGGEGEPMAEEAMRAGAREAREARDAKKKPAAAALRRASVTRQAPLGPRE